MKDDQLWQDLKRTNAPDNITKSLPKRRVKTYSDCFALLRDQTANVHHHIAILMALGHLSHLIDKRRAVPSLLVALKSDDELVRDLAIGNLGHFRSRRAVQPLIEIAHDKRQPNDTRTFAIQALADIGDARAIPALNQIIHDEGENLWVRSAAIEWNRRDDDNEALNDYITLLSHPAADIRFWAAYRLSEFHSDVDLSPALSRLDQLVSFDHSLPIYYGWPVSREAIQPLETIYSRLLGLARMQNGWWFSTCSWLVSPTAEYFTFMQKYRHWKNDGELATDKVPPVNLKLNLGWLADKLRENWPDIETNVREPRPQAYLLDWKLTISEQPLIGGLLRDQYGVVLTGEDEAVNAFAVWYRSIIAPEHSLYLYQWADPGVELKPGMTADEIKTGYDALWQKPLQTDS